MARAHPTARSETRPKVLDAAYLVFGERGIAGTSLEQVAVAADLTKGRSTPTSAPRTNLS